MRPLILSAIFIISHSAYGQDTIKIRQLGFDYSVGINYFASWNSLPSITYSTSKHSVFAGPIIVNLNSLDEGYYENFTPSIAIHTGYQFYPYGRRRRFNLFFEYNFLYLKTKTIVHDYERQPIQMWGGIKTKTIDLFSLENYLCYGFRLNISKGLYFQTNVGTGFGWYRYREAQKYWDGQYGAGQSKPYFWKFSNIFKIGLGFDFSILKKK
jgi:hypothetical protein